MTYHSPFFNMVTLLFLQKHTVLRQPLQLPPFCPELATTHPLVGVPSSLSWGSPFVFGLYSLLILPVLSSQPFPTDLQVFTCPAQKVTLP